MATIIKSGVRTGQAVAPRQVPFNFDDMAAQAETYLDGVRAEGAKIIAEARAEAEAISSVAERQGYQAAMTEAESLVDTKIAAQVKTLLPALREAVDGIQQAKQSFVGHWEASAIHVARVIAEKVIRQNLPRMSEVTPTLIREALELAAGSQNVRLHLNPADHESLGDAAQQIIQEMSSVATTQVVSDPNISLGGCRVVMPMGTVDQQFEAQLDRIEEELT
jgi:flagellar assembly protein FliH